MKSRFKRHKSMSTGAKGSVSADHYKLRWRVGRDKDGAVPRLSDGLPAFAVSECGDYTLSRVILGSGVHYEGWFQERGKVPVHLGGSYDRDDVIRVCDAHARARLEAACA